jgi:large subunit ribosomal protein L24
MQKCHVKKGDLVVIISGEERGNRGKVLEVQRDKSRVIVEGLMMIKKCLKKNTNQNRPQGAIIEREVTIHVSNVMLAEQFDARAAKRGGAAPVEAKA